MTQRSSGSWVLIDIDLQDACEHFSKSIALFNKRGFENPGIDGYEAKMALMHSMQCGHTSLENGLLKILRLLDEPFVKEERWHHDLIVQCSTDTADRGTILEEDLAEHAQVTRGFRNLATRRYQKRFDSGLAQLAVQSGEILSQRLPACLDAFKLRIDPPEHNNGGGGDGSGGAMGGGPR